MKYQPFALQIGSVSRDFSITAAATESLAPTLGSSATWSLTLKRVGSGVVRLQRRPLGGGDAGEHDADRARRRVLLLGVGRPGSGSGTTVSLTINAGTLAAGQYRMVVRATGMNGDSPNRKVTHLLPIVLSVATGTSTSNTEYVDITGFAVMRIASINSNTAYAYAVTPMIADMRTAASVSGRSPGWSSGTDAGRPDGRKPRRCAGAARRAMAATGRPVAFDLTNPRRSPSLASRADTSSPPRRTPTRRRR